MPPFSKKTGDIASIFDSIRFDGSSWNSRGRKKGRKAKSKKTRDKKESDSSTVSTYAEHFRDIFLCSCLGTGASRNSEMEIRDGNDMRRRHSRGGSRNVIRTDRRRKKKPVTVGSKMVKMISTAQCTNYEFQCGSRDYNSDDDGMHDDGYDRMNSSNKFISDTVSVHRGTVRRKYSKGQTAEYIKRHHSYDSYE